MRRRVGLTITLLIVVAGIVIWVIWSQNLRNAPLQLNQRTPVASATTAPEATADPTQLDMTTPPFEIAYISNKDGSWDIVTMLPDGSERNLTNDDSAAADYFVSYAMDSSQINFLSNRQNEGELGPSRVNPDGGDLRNLDILGAVMTTFREGKLDWDPAWSSDGQQMVWSSVRDLGLEVYTVPLADEFSMANATRLTQNSPLARDWFPAWSPDSTVIVYTSDRDGNENIYRYDVASGTTTQLTDHPQDDIHPAYTLDGEQIVFVSERDTPLATGTLSLYIMNPDGSNQRRLPEGDRLAFDPVWSPDGQYMAYTDNRSGTWQIYIANADGSNAQRLTTGDADYLFPVWRP